MLWFGKKIKQDICLLTETNKVKDESISDVGILHIESPETAEAWLLNQKQMCKDENTGQYVQFVSSQNCVPIKIYRNGSNEKTTDMSLISSQTDDAEMVFIDTKSSKNSQLLWIGICLALLTLTVLVVALVRIT